MIEVCGVFLIRSVWSLVCFLGVRVRVLGVLDLGSEDPVGTGFVDLGQALQKKNCATCGLTLMGCI